MTTSLPRRSKAPSFCHEQPPLRRNASRRHFILNAFSENSPQRDSRHFFRIFVSAPRADKEFENLSLLVLSSEGRVTPVQPKLYLDVLYAFALFLLFYKLHIIRLYFGCVNVDVKSPIVRCACTRSFFVSYVKAETVTIFLRNACDSMS